MISASYCIVAILLACVNADKDVTGLRAVSQHRSRMSFANVLTQAMKSEAFQQQVAKTVPMMCDDSDNPSNCKKVITKSLLCTSFLEKAKSLQLEEVGGVDNFILRCKSIERQVPNLSSVFHWVQNPEEVFNNVVHKAEGDTGLTLNGALKTLSDAHEAL